MTFIDGESSQWTLALADLSRRDWPVFDEAVDVLQGYAFRKSTRL